MSKASRLFEQQVAVYASYHADPRNRLTHYFGVPMIAFSVLLLLELWSWGSLSLGVATYLALAVLWIWMSPLVGVVLVALLAPLVLAAGALAAAMSPAMLWSVFAALFVGGWALQLLGHVFEGRRPALVDNLFQILVSPMFFAAELLHAVGLARTLPVGVAAVIRAQGDARAKSAV